jgi:multidrug transporter EmrE-like cation transporter
MTSTPAGYLWCGAAALASSLSTLMIKFSSHAGPDWTLARLAWLAAAIASYALGFACYTLALQKLQISLAYPVMTAVTMVLVTVLGCAVLQEPLAPAKLLGITLIIVGAFVLAR